MSLSIYQVSVPTFMLMLNNLKAILLKAEDFAAERGIDSADMVSFSLAPGMFDLANQVFVSTDSAKGCAARLAGQTPPVYDDKEKTLAELCARIDRTVAYLAGFSEADLEGGESRNIVLEFPGVRLEYIGIDYLNKFALPNFFFHVTTAYDILRSIGVDLGKGDFLAGGESE